MKIYIMTDYEGVAGIVDFEGRADESAPNIIKRQRGARLLTGEVNAAVEGCFLGGADEVLIDDAHGRGYTIDPEILDSRARIVHGTRRPRIMPGLDASFDAMIMIGAHAMARTKGGVLYHTMCLECREFRLNGKPAGEFAIFAFVAGAFDVPAIMISGDTAACKEAKKIIPGIVAVSVKEGLSRYAAISLSKDESRKRIREGVETAVKNIRKVKPYKLKAPFTYQNDIFTKPEKELMASHPDDLPKQWISDPLIKARTAKELIKKVWSYKV